MVGFLCDQIPEFGQMLKEQICPLVIKLFSPSIKHHRTLSSSSNSSSNLPLSDRPSFVISMRLLKIVSALVQQYYQRLVSEMIKRAIIYCRVFQVTECEIFLSLLVKFIDHDKPLWQRTLAVEVLHAVAIYPTSMPAVVQQTYLTNVPNMAWLLRKFCNEILNCFNCFINWCIDISSSWLRYLLNNCRQDPDSCCNKIWETSFCH